MSMIFWIIMLIIILIPWSRLLRLRKSSAEENKPEQEQQNDQQ